MLLMLLVQEFHQQHQLLRNDNRQLVSSPTLQWSALTLLEAFITPWTLRQNTSWAVSRMTPARGSTQHGKRQAGLPFSGTLIKRVMLWQEYQQGQMQSPQQGLDNSMQQDSLGKAGVENYLQKRTWGIWQTTNWTWAGSMSLWQERTTT